QSVGAGEYFFEVAQALQRRRMIDEEFFVRLQDERSRRGARIRELQGLWAGREQAEGGPPAAADLTPVAPIVGMTETAVPRRFRGGPGSSSVPARPTPPGWSGPRSSSRS